ncbi:hypothetical protein GCM10009838_12720 [Catenulispora subtropica]|uniref:Uncharacterized protein n=1 Tax=Catenulispora subtropica TaxID=450798 RepID=A0ABN2QU55_9ACTN
MAGNAAALGEAEEEVEVEAVPDAAGADFDDEHPAASNAEPAMTPTATCRATLCRRECTRSAPPADPRPRATHAGPGDRDAHSRTAPNREGRTLTHRVRRPGSLPGELTVAGQRRIPTGFAAHVVDGTPPSPQTLASTRARD